MKLWAGKGGGATFPGLWHIRRLFFLYHQEMESFLRRQHLGRKATETEGELVGYCLPVASYGNLGVSMA